MPPLRLLGALTRGRWCYIHLEQLVSLCGLLKFEHCRERVPQVDAGKSVIILSKDPGGANRTNWL